MSNIFNRTSGSELPEEINPTESGAIEIKQLDDSDGDFYPKTHVNAVDGIEKYDNGIIGLTNDLINFADGIVTDTGWIDYTPYVHKDVKPNILYSSDGFSCGIREIVHFYGAEEVKTYSKKMIRVNLREFTNGQKIAQLPTGFMKNTQVFYSRSGSGKQPIMVELRGNGDMNVYIESVDQSGSAFSNWIYAQFEWTE